MVGEYMTNLRFKVMEVVMCGFRTAAKLFSESFALKKSKHLYSIEVQLRYLHIGCLGCHATITRLCFSHSLFLHP